MRYMPKDMYGPCFTIFIVLQIILSFRCGNVAFGTTLSECKERYSKLDYLNTTENPGEIDSRTDSGIPPLLLSYPGAGNTFVRSLIEYATGIYSCSIYLNDKEMSNVFPGEQTCDRKCSIIKGHPTDFNVTVGLDIHNRPARRGDKREKLRGNNPFMRKKCGKGNIQHFSSAIILVRDPYASILSDFQRIVTNSHQGTVNLANSKSYSSRNSRRDPLHNKNITKLWQRVILDKGKEFYSSMPSVIRPILMSNKNPTQYPNLNFSTTIVRFEDLMSNDTRIDTLHSLVMRALPTSRRARVTPQRLECAFVLTENREGIKRKKKYLTLKQMYHEIDPTIPCQLEPYLRSFTGNFSYPLYPRDTPPSLCDRRGPPV